MECIKCKDSNSSKKTIIKLNNNCLKIVYYNESTIFFNISEISNGYLGTCMDFEKILNDERNECINKPNFEETILKDNMENTKIIDNSNEVLNNTLYEIDEKISESKEDSNGIIETTISLMGERTNGIDSKEDVTKSNESNTSYIDNYNTNNMEFTENYDKIKESNINFVIIDSISINNNECSFGVFDKEKNADELEELIMSNITSYTSSCKIYNGTNFIVSVVPSNKIDPKEQINKGISAFDLGNCTNELKEFYNISREENLIILNIETKNDNNQNEEDNKSFKLG